MRLLHSREYAVAMCELHNLPHECDVDGMRDITQKVFGYDATNSLQTYDRMNGLPHRKLGKRVLYDTIEAIQWYARVIHPEVPRKAKRKLNIVLRLPQKREQESSPNP